MLRFVIYILIFPMLAIASDMDIILKSNAYLVGRGENVDFDRADQRALADLISQISVTVESEFKDVIRETDKDLKSFAESIVTSYSSAILANVEKKTDKLKNGAWVVYRYIKKADKNKIFRLRKEKIIYYVKTGLRAKDVNDFDIALKSLYWALILLKSHPEKNEIYYSDGEEKHPLNILLPVEIKGMLDVVKLNVSNIVESSGSNAVYIKAFNDKGRINNMKLKYFDGESMIPANIKDGKGAIYLPSNYCKSVAEVDAAVDYMFNDLLGDNPEDEEVKMVSGYISIAFDNNKSISLKKAPKKSVQPEIQKTENRGEEELASITQALLDAIKTRNFRAVEEYFSPEGYRQFKNIMNYGKVRLFEGEHSIHFVPFGDRMMIRSIPIVTQLTDRHKRVVHDDIVPIIEDGKIVWTNFAINDRDAQDAIERGEQCEDLQERLTCLTFMEYYKTIFALKDLAKITEVFTDDAVIFVGYVKNTEEIDPKLKDLVRANLSEENFEKQRLTKTDYINRLRTKAFVNPFVNIQFSDMEIIRRSETPPIFGIQLYQDYYSTNYADTGYLMLLTDNTHPKEPRIFFRYWQPERITDKAFTVGDFKLPDSIKGD